MRPQVRRLLVLTPLALCVCKTAPPSQPPIDRSIPAASPSPKLAAEAEPVPPPTVYGHVRIAAPTALIEQIQQQLLPPAQRLMFNESTLRSIIGMQLGERSGLAQNVDLTRPMGCVVTSAKRYDQPMACAMAYTGGLDRLVEDLGREGYVSGGNGYAAYRIDGQPLYLTAMDTHVAMALAPDLTAGVRDRLQRDIIDAPAGDEDVEGAVFVATIFEDIPEQIEQFAESSARAPGTGQPIQQAQRESQRRQLMSFGELERADLWLDVAPQRVRLGYRGTARAGTATAKAYEDLQRIPADPELLEVLPAESFMVASMRFDPASFADDPMLGSYIRSLGEMDDTGAAAATAEIYRKSLSLWQEIATGHAAIGMFHLEGTLGGLVMAYRLEPGVDALPKLRENLERIGDIKQPDFPVETTVQRGKLRIGKVRGDLVTMRPSADLQAKMKEGPAWDTISKAIGGSPQIQLAYAQHGDVLYMTFTVRNAKRYLARALGAGRGKKNLGGDRSAMARLERHQDSSMSMLVDVRRALDWLVRVDAMERLSGPVGGEFDDVVLSMRPGAQGQREVLLDVSQSLVDDLIALGG